MVKKVKKFQHGKNLKRKWKQMKQKKNPKVNADVLKGYWDPKKTLAQNYMELGLSMNPNETLAIPKTKDKVNPDKEYCEVMDIEEAKALAKKNKEEMKTDAVKKLTAISEQKSDKGHNLNENDQLLCIYMLEKYQDDYKKMARDYKNYYQDTPAQLRKRINQFKSMKKAYAKYLEEKSKGTDFLKDMETGF